MNPYKSLFALAGLALAGFGFTSCDDDFECPPVYIPEATWEANTPISEFKQNFWKYATGAEYAAIPLNADGDSIIIGGRIVSSDDGGNMYKQIVVQDQSGAILIGVNASGLNAGRYKLGEEIFVNLTGLYVGNYNNLMQIGQPYNGSIGRIDEDVMKVHTQVNGLPDPEALNALVISPSIADINGWKKNQEDLCKYQSVLVTLKNVSFEGGGELAWSDNPGGKYYTTRTLTDSEGNRLNVNTSNQCNFSGQLLPAGKGDVTAILSYFKEDWQLVVCDPATDCTGFDEVPADNVIFSAPLSSSMDGFTIENVTEIPASLGEAWKLDTKYNCMVAKGYDGTKNFATDSWLVSPVIDLTGMETAWATFRHAQNYFGSAALARSEATFAVRVEGTTEWKKLTINYPEYGSGFNFVSAGDIELKEYAGKKVQFGWHYISTASKAGTWEMNNFMVKRQCIGTPNIPVEVPDTPDTPDTPTGAVFSESFATGLGSFTQENTKLPEGLTYIWSWYEQGKCAKASGFANKQAYDTEAYLVSPVITIPAAGAVMSFEQATNFFGSTEDARKETSVCIREEGTTAWTTLTVPDYPSSQSWTFVPSGNIDLKAYAGKKVQVGFRYTSTAAKAGTWEFKNLVVK